MPLQQQSILGGTASLLKAQLEKLQKAWQRCKDGKAGSAEHATVCAVDRFWSELGNMIPAKRTRLAMAKADKMMLVRNSYRISRNITKDDKEEEPDAEA
jgi:hypothetical protein